MFPFKKILCPTDFSETSLCGVKMAKEMVDRFDSEIVLANVHKPIPELPHPRVEGSDMVFDISGYQKSLALDAEENLKKIANDIFGPEAKVKLVVRLGKPSDEILAVAKEEEVDAIFISTHGHTGLAKIVFGSVAQRIIRKANCPVLSIKSCD